MKWPKSLTTKIIISEKIDRKNDDILYKKDVIDQIGNSKLAQNVALIAISIRIFFWFYAIVLLTLISYIFVNLNFYKEAKSTIVLSVPLILVFPLCIPGYVNFNNFGNIPYSSFFKRPVWTNRVSRIFFLSRYTNKTDEDIEYLFGKYLSIDYDLKVVKEQTKLNETQKKYSFKFIKWSFFIEEFSFVLMFLTIVCLMISILFLFWH